MRKLYLGICLLLVAGCVTEEEVTDPAADTAVDSGGSGSDAGDDTLTADSSSDGGDDTTVEDTAADTAVDDTAADGSSDTMPDDTSIEDTGSDTTVADTMDVEACLLDCGVGCPAPEFQICGADGERYCNSCYMNCYGVQPAGDPSICSPCGVYDSSTAVAYREWTAPSSCFMSFDSGASFAIATSEGELRAMLPCMDAAEPVTGIDWTTEQVVRVVQSYNPSIAVQGVFASSDGTIVATRSPVYCGGAAPPTSAAFVIIAAGAPTPRQESCIDGVCSGGPFP